MSPPDSQPCGAQAWHFELAAARAAARAAGAILARHYRSGARVWEKSAGNPVTPADLEADASIRAALAQAFPGDGLLSEETADDFSRLTRRRVWLVDPMDGTREFTQALPEFAVSIALVEDGEPAVGVVFNPVAGSEPAGVEVWATRGGGSFCGERRLRLDACSRIDEARALASRSELARSDFASWFSGFASLEPMGSIAWKLAVIARGEADFTLSLAPKHEWDVCAGDLIVREAGGRYVDLGGQPRTYNQPQARIAPGMLAGPPELIEAFLATSEARALRRR